MTDVCSNPALMLNFEPSMQGITTTNLTQEEAIVKFPPLRGNIAPPQKDNYEGYDIIPDNTSSVQEDPWTCTASAAPSGAGSTAPIRVTSTSAQLPPPLEAEKAPFSLSSIKQVKNLVSKENTNITLALIGADEVASCVDATTTQAFDVKMKKDSSNKEPDGGDTDLDYGDVERVSVLSDERVSVLSDEEDEQTAKSNIVTPVTTEGDDAQATQTSNPGKAIGDDTAETQEDKDSDDDDKKPTGPRNGSILHDPVVLAAGRISKSASDHVSVRVVQWIVRVHLLTFSDLIGQNELSKIFFRSTVMCLNGSIA